MTYDGAEVFDLRKGKPGDLLKLIGKGLTAAGKAALGAEIANLSIAEMAEVLELRDLNPVVVVEFLTDLRTTYFTVVSCEKLSNIVICSSKLYMHSTKDFIFYKDFLSKILNRKGISDLNNNSYGNPIQITHFERVGIFVL